MAYGKVQETFWLDPKVRALPEPARILFLYLLTCPHRNRLGCFVADPFYMAADLQWNPEKVRAAVNDLEQAGRIRWDEEHRVLWLCHYFKHNTLENLNVVKGAVSDLQSLPDTPLLIGLYRRLQEHIERDVEPKRRDRFEPLLPRLERRIRRIGHVENSPRDASGSDVENPPEPAPEADDNGSGNGSANGSPVGSELRSRSLYRLQSRSHTVSREDEGVSENPDSGEGERPSEPPGDPPPAATGLDQVVDLVGEENREAVEAVASLARNPKLWAIAFVGEWRFPGGTLAERYLPSREPENHSDILAEALLRYIGTGQEWDSRFFRSMVESIVAKRTRDRATTPDNQSRHNSTAERTTEELRRQEEEEGEAEASMAALWSWWEDQDTEARAAIEKEAGKRAKGTPRSLHRAVLIGVIQEHREAEASDDAA